MTNHLITNPFSENNLKKAWQLITQAQHITLLAHRNPDGDAISSCAALETTLQELPGSKNFETIYPTKPYFSPRRSAKTVLINTHMQQPDLLISCDTAQYERLYYPESFQGIPHINIDHHISNTMKGTVNFVDPLSSSTCEVIYLLLTTWDSTLITTYAAECILAGILSDTQVFHISPTSARVLRIAANLMDKGVNLYKLKEELFTHRNPQIIALWGNLLSSISFSKNQKAAWVTITQDNLKKYNLSLAALTGFINFLSGIAGIDITALFYETEEGHTKVSLRSKITDINALAAKFGGGGHIHAAGIHLEKPIDKVIQKVTAEFETI